MKPRLATPEVSRWRVIEPSSPDACDGEVSVSWPPVPFAARYSAYICTDYRRWRRVERDVRGTYTFTGLSDDEINRGRFGIRAHA